MHNEINSPPDYQKLLTDSFSAVKRLNARVQQLEAEKHEPIAIIGIGCRFPGGINSPDDFWRLLANGEDAITEIPSDRWHKDHYYDPNPDAPGKMYTWEGGFIGAKDLFDPQFFRISPREADFMDPQQRVLLELAWETMEDAGIPAERLRASNTGVYVGISVFDYANLITKSMPEAEVDYTIGTGNALSAASGRLSYVLGLKGPSLSLDTACSSSLVAVHMACESLRRRECNAAFAGGVNMMLSPFNHVVFCRARMLANDGRCKTFDEAANGYVRSEGAGMVLLKRLSDALADRDNIRAVIRGGAINQDGASGGLTVPNGPAQCQVIHSALDNARVNPSEIDYVEAHGTGTALGDPIEMNALGQVFAGNHNERHPLYIGSVKTNVGHMEAAAGIGGLIKVVLQLQHGAFVPHLHLKNPSAKIPWAELPFKISASREAWPPAGEKKRMAGISSFGFTGTNAHLIVEEAPCPAGEQSPEQKRSMYLLTLSAATADALKQLAGRYACCLAQRASWHTGNVCHSANTGRSIFDHRLAVTAASTMDLARKLKAISEGQIPADVCKNDPFKTGQTGKPKIAFLYSGEGSQFPGMGKELYETHPLFREVLNRCDTVVRQETGWSPLDALYGGSSPDRETEYVQPLIYSIQHALSLLWKSWGIEPVAVMGYGLGEYAAATFAGGLDFEEALKMVIARARLIESLPAGGGMMAVRQTEQKVREMIAPFAAEVFIAGVNEPRHVVIAGRLASLRRVAALLDNAGIRSKELGSAHALYSPHVEPILSQFADAASRISFSNPHLAIVSGKSGAIMRERPGPQYWVEQSAAPVRFRDGIETLYRMGCTAFVEIGPRTALTDMGRQCIQANVNWFNSMRPGRNDWEQLLQAMAEMFTKGFDLDFEALDREYASCKLNLPTYPFQRERHWFTSAMRRN